jgi:hypothetical protein
VEDGSRFVGSAQPRPRALLLEGRTNGSERLSLLPYRDVARIVVERSEGRPELALELRNARRIVITSLDQTGTVLELAEELHRLADSPQR